MAYFLPLHPAPLSGSLQQPSRRLPLPGASLHQPPDPSDSSTSSTHSSNSSTSSYNSSILTDSEDPVSAN